MNKVEHAEVREKLAKHFEEITNDYDEYLGEAMSDEQASFLSQACLQNERILKYLGKGISELIDLKLDNNLIKLFKERQALLTKLMEGKLTAYCLARPLGKYACGLYVPSPVVASLVSNLKIKNKDDKIICHNAVSLWRICLNNDEEFHPLKQCMMKFMRDIKVKNGGKIPGYYQKIFRERLYKEVEKNDSGEYADIAEKKIDSSSSYAMSPHFKMAYKQGKFPVMQLESRAAMHTAKYFLANYFESLWEFEMKTPAAQSFIPDGDTKIYIERPIVEGIVGIAYLNLKAKQSKGVIVGKAPEGSLEPTAATE